MTGQSSQRALALTFVLPPYRDRAALVAGSWLGLRTSAGESVDVLTASLDRFRHRDDGSLDLLPDVGRRLEVSMDQPPQAWGSYREFLEKGLDCLAGSGIAEQYAVLLSSVPTGHSVLLGAALRARLPASRWVVLLAEPGFTAYDRARVVIPDDCPTRELMRGILESGGARAPESADASVWLELLVATVADELVVPTEAQRAALVAAHGDDLGTRVTVQPLPVPPEGMSTDGAPASLDTRPDVVDVGWFDDDPAQQQLTVVLEALRSLPLELRQAIRLHLVSERPQAYERRVPPELAGVVTTVGVTDVRSRLAAMRAVDVVLVLETGGTASGRGLRWSWVEALGSGTRIIGVGPRGGSLSELVPSILPSGHRTALMQLLAQLAAEPRTQALTAAGLAHAALTPPTA